MTPLVLAQAEEHLVHVRPLTAVIIGVLMLVLNAFFVAAEIALLAARRARIEELAEAGDPRARLALAALRQLSITFSGAQLGITITSVVLGAVAEPAVVGALETVLGLAPLPEAVSHAIALAFGLAIVVFLHMVIGEMVPKNLALAQAERVALRIARPFTVYMVVLKPLIVALNSSANWLVRLVGIEPRDEMGLVHTPSELALLLRETRRHGLLMPQDVHVLSAALALGEIDAEAAMTPRVDLESIRDDAPARDVLRLSSDTGFTRFPVFHRDADDVVGLVHVKDVLIRDDAEIDGLTVADVLRPVPAVPQNVDLQRLMRDMRRDRSHAVLVVDEFGGTAGLLTLEDVLEELVGEIEDEFDPRDPDIRRLAPGRWIVPGTFRRDELERLTGLVLEDGDSETLSGYLTQRLGRLVRPGDELQTEGWRLRVRSIDGRRAGDVEVAAPEPDA